MIQTPFSTLKQYRRKKTIKQIISSYLELIDIGALVMIGTLLGVLSSYYYITLVLGI